MPHNDLHKEEFSFKSFFIPLTSIKACFIFIVVGFIIYGNTLFNEFVWDDITQIVTSPLTLSSIPSLFTSGQVGIFYRPGFLSYLIIVNTLSHGSVFFFHIIQVGMHILNAFLVFILFKKLINKNIAFISALIFLVHPINTEAVVYISAVADIFIFTLGILALLNVSHHSLKFKSYIYTGVFILLSLFMKESGIFWLLIVLIYILLFKRIKKSGVAILLILSIGIYSFMRFIIANAGLGISSQVSIIQLTFEERLLSIPKIIFYYIQTFFYPLTLAIAQLWVVRALTFQDFYLPLLLDLVFIGFIAFWGIFIYRYHKIKLRTYIFFAAWFILSLGMYLQLYPLDMTVAERWFYIPMIGLLGMFGVVSNSVSLNHKAQKVAIIFFIIIILCLSLRTMVRNLDWSNSYTLFSHDVQSNPDSYSLHANLAYSLVALQKFDEAEKHAKKALVLEPKNTSTWEAMGTIYMRQNKVKESIPFFVKSLEYNGGNYISIYNLTYGYLLLDDFASANNYADKGLATYPQDSQLMLFKAIANYQLGNYQDALQEAAVANSTLQNQNSNYIYTQILNKQPLIYK